MPEDKVVSNNRINGLSRELIEEFGEILDEEFQLKLDYPSLEKLANFLVSYFQLLLKVKN